MAERQSKMSTATRPTTDDRDEWKAYWEAQGMPWRTEAEITNERQQYLEERRVGVTDAKTGIAPFRGIELDRADVEWLLAALDHDPISWPDARQRGLYGPQLSFAVLRRVNLTELPLARANLEGVSLENAVLTHVHLEGATLRAAKLQGANLQRARLEGADLADSDLSRADLDHAHMEGIVLPKARLIQATLTGSHLERADLTGASIAGANLRRAKLDSGTTLDGLVLTSDEHGAAQLADVRWGGANLTVVDWEQLHALGDDVTAKRADQKRSTTDKGTCISEFKAAVRANRQLAIALRSQGLNDDADRFAFEAQKLQRRVFRLQGRRPQYLGSWFLFLIAGYGYRPVFSFISYAAVVLTFACAYLWLGSHVSPSLSPLDAVVFSMTSFHGRGFSPGEAITLHNPVTILAAAEAFVGLLIEISLIATFTQRFFAR